MTTSTDARVAPQTFTAPGGTGYFKEINMKSEVLEKTEAECAEGRTAPRVSLDAIRNAIASEHYTNGARAAGISGSEPHPLDVLTVCFLVMKNGFTIIGKSAPASPANFDANLGKKLAYEDAVRQVWPLMGFSLRDRLAD